MKTEIITIANLKCSGCENTIVSKIIKMTGVKKVSVDKNQDCVTIEHDEKTGREAFVKTLTSLGYPEATEKNGLLMRLKSYKSCAVGRMKK